MAKNKKNKLTAKQKQYLIKKFMGDHGGLTPRNIEIELHDDYEFAEITTIGGRTGTTIRKK